MNHPIIEEPNKSEFRRYTKSTRKPKIALYVLRFTTHTEMKKTSFEQHFGRKPRTKLSNLKNAILVNSKELSVYIT